MVELFKCKGISFTNRRNKKGLRIDPCSGIILCPSFTNCRHPSRYSETKPRYLGWHHTLIISSIIDCDRVCQELYGNQQILVL